MLSKYREYKQTYMFLLLCNVPKMIYVETIIQLTALGAAYRPLLLIEYNLKLEAKRYSWSQYNTVVTTS